MKIKFNSTQRITSEAKDVLKRGLTKAFGEDASVRMVRSEPGPDVVNFGGAEGIRTLSPMRLCQYPNGAGYAAVAFRKAAQEDLFPVPWDCDPNQVLYFDIETYSASDVWKMAPRQFFRLGQYAWGPQGEVVLTTDYDEMLRVISQAYGVVGHNIHNFDLSALHGTDSMIPLEMAMNGRVFDTFVHAILAAPAPSVYVDRNGHTFYGDKDPGNTLKWLGLDNLCFQLGLSGKIGDLKALAKKYNPPGTLVDDYDYGLIPLDDPDFLAYAVQDVVAVRELACALIIMSAPTEYDWREQLNAAIDAQNSRNGVRVDKVAAQRRADELSARKEEILAGLVEKYNFPMSGAQPWKSKVGKQAIFDALADHGIVPDEIPNWTLTKTGKISLGGKVLLEFTAGTDAEYLGAALAELMGQRTLSQLALDSMQPDGKDHPDITAVQRSGRKSTTKPGLTVWSSRGSKAVEKSYFIPDNENESLVEFDYSNADQRIIAALSGDTEYLKRFEEGVDGHVINARLMFGDEKYESDPAYYRDKAKAPGHAYTYGAQAKKLAESSGLPIEDMYRFCAGMARTYPDVTEWQDTVRDEGKSGLVVNDWGRVMVVDPSRAFTQAPALFGQSGTREIVVDALIRMAYADLRLIRWLKMQVHDALVFSIPDEHLHWAVPKIRELMETKWQPKDGSGQLVEFPVSSGSPAKTWELAGH